jgi:uncharacterized LabA/DUF88 family protein
LRAAIFIDGAYLLSFTRKHGFAPKYEAIADYLLKPLRKKVPLDLLRCYFYYCAPWMSNEPSSNEKKRMEEHEELMTEITSQERWAVKLGKLQKRWDGKQEYFEQKRVDVLLSVDMVRHAAAGHIQHVIVLAGDSDFIPAIAATKESGATVTVYYAEDNTVHKDLIDLADISYQMNINRFPRKKLPAQKKPVQPKKQQPVQALKKPKPASKRRYRSRNPRNSNSSGSNSSNSSNS